MLYDFREEEPLLALIRKVSDDGYETLCTEKIDFPEDSLYEEGEDFSAVYEDTFQDVFEDEFGELYNPGLREVLWSDADHFMLDAGLRALGISDGKEIDRKAWENIHISAVLLAGAESEYPFVMEHLKEITGAEICRINALETVGARGAIQ